MSVHQSFFETPLISEMSRNDPMDDMPAPSWAAGQADRSPDFDALPGFRTPPPGFGIVPFFWWLGDTLTKERLAWILSQMENFRISGYQINYAHGYKDGGKSYGLSLPSDPPLFSEAWWNLARWFMTEAKAQGAAVSLSDYTIGIGQGWILDELIAGNPGLCGATLALIEGTAADALVTSTITDADGKTRTVSVIAKQNPVSIDPMHPLSGAYYAKRFFGAFEERFPGEAGRGLNFFFSDELVFGVSGNLWNDRFAGEFRTRKGYDIVPELASLFIDTGPRTPKVRLDYRDVMTALTEEGFFKPVFEWHQQRGMTMGCDHGGRGRDVTEFGDYFRTQRWNQGPGSDQPHLGRDIVKAKVAASMAHLYRRPRVWLEGYYSSGWGTSSAQVVDATFANFVNGYNLLSLHGMYYATRGGWWEWAPPDNTFRMPYWSSMRGFTACVERLSYLMSQGEHRCDVAVLYPVAPAEAGLGGKEAAECAFDAVRKICTCGIDCDFMDFQSLDRAVIHENELHVSGERYRVLILPAMRAVRHTTLVKALAFRRAGGTVIALGTLPEASDRMGFNDPEVTAMVRELFPDGVSGDIVAAVTAAIPVRDYSGPGMYQHRRIGRRDLYAVYGAPGGSEALFRAVGRIELWDPWTGSTAPLAAISQMDGVTTLRLPLTETEMQLIVFNPEGPVVEASSPPSALREIPVNGMWDFELEPTMDNRYGDFHWPPTSEYIGAEVRRIRYAEGMNTPAPDDTNAWHMVSASFGPRFLKCSGMPDLTAHTAPAGVPIECSWRWGIENDPGVQGYHGLKAVVHDELFAVGVRQEGSWEVTYLPEAQDTFLWSSAYAPAAMTARIHSGRIKPVQAWLNGREISGTTVELTAGANILVLRYAKEKTGRTYFVLSTTDPAEPGPEIYRYPDGVKPVFVPNQLSAKWAGDTGRIELDTHPGDASTTGWYRFQSPPGLRGFTVKSNGMVTAAVNGVPAIETTPGVFTLATPVDNAEVMLRIDAARGHYAGAALLEPIRLHCGPGKTIPGDWSTNDGLACYSGAAWYRKHITLPPAKRYILDLGDLVSSAECRVNGKPAGVKVSPPWTFDISALATPGENFIEVRIASTLGNHYRTIPTKYRGAVTAGLLGPVKILAGG